MKLYIEPLSLSGNIEVEVEATATIRQVKEAFAAQFASCWRVETTVFWWGGTRLQDERTVESYDLSDGKTLHCTSEPSAPRRPSPTFQIPVGLPATSTAPGRWTTLVVSADQRISDVKEQMVRDLAGLPREFDITYMGEVCITQYRLRDYDITDASEPLVVRPRP
jgi:hypothetical protein